MSDEVIDSGAAGGSGERPTFLTVLCILTWIGSGWGAIAQFVTEDYGLVPMWYKLGIVACCVATGVGAWMMWNLKKQGLMIYTAGEVLGIILPFIFVYGILGGSGILAEAMMMALIIGAIFPIAFIVMYWANAKHLS